MGRATTRRRELDLERVREAVYAAELHTSAEIVVSIAPFFIGRTWPAARRVFDRLGVARTRLRNGVLVFVVPARRKVIVLADDGAHAQIEQTVWEDIATRIAAAFARGHGTDALVDGVTRLGAALAAAFPRTHDDVNELPDEPVIVRF